MSSDEALADERQRRWRLLRIGKRRPIGDSLPLATAQMLA
jgi:hypothetical protein